MIRPSFLVKIVYVLLVFQSHSVCADLSEDDLKLMPATKIIEFAKMGDPIAQYWLGDAIYNGAIDNWRDLGFPIEWWEKAANQNHIIAAYKAGFAHLYRSISPTKDEGKGLIYLQKAANADLPEAHWALYRKFLNDDKILAYYHLKQAASLGLSEGLSYLATLKIHGTQNGLIEKDVEAAITLYHQSLDARQNQFSYSEDIDSLFCNTITDLNKIYSGEEVYSQGYKNPIKNIEILEKGVARNCNLAMLQLSEILYLGADTERDVERAYAIAYSAYSLGGPSNPLRDLLGFNLAKMSVSLGDTLNAKKFISEVLEIGGFWAETALNSNEIGSKICKVENVNPAECKAFLMNK